jgi:hypothetical protein
MTSRSAPQVNPPSVPTRSVFTGLHSVDAGEVEELNLGHGFSLCKPNDALLSVRDRSIMSGFEYDEATRVSRYLVYKQVVKGWSEEGIDERQQAEAMFWNGLMAFQIVKPTATVGLTFEGLFYGTPSFHLETTERRPPMDPGQWARMRQFDAEFLGRVPPMIQRVKHVMEGASAETRNAIILLELGLEHNHPLIAGLLWVMGMESIFDSGNRNDFEKKVCNCLGPTAAVFPDWNSPRYSSPAYTVREMAIPIYMLRNKLAHGADLRKAATDKTTPVDLIKKVKLADGLEDRAHAYVLSEAACYLLCQVLQKTI